MNLSGSPLDYLVAFVGGVAISFTPCVYPLIPITISYIGIKSGDSRFKDLILSFVYTSGIAVTYTFLGLLASLTGKVFGLVSTHPFTHIAVGIVIALFGLFMLNLFPVPLRNFIKLPAKIKHNYVSAFFLGLSSGFIISPCVTPVVGSILVYLATKENIWHGMSLLICFGYGMGLILILAGTFSGILTRLPKSGKWTAYLEKIYAVILMVTGAYFIFSGLRRL
jgi:cytochrome c-type biogenesis protein